MGLAAFAAILRFGKHTATMLSRRHLGRYLTVCILLVILYVIIIPSASNPVSIENGWADTNQSQFSSTVHQPISLQDHLHDIFQVYAQHWPDVDRLNNYKDGKTAPQKAFEDKLPILSNEELGEFLQVNESDLNKLRTSHSNTVRDLPDSFPEGLFKGTGIATVAGWRYSPVMLTTLRMLRRVSPHIPIEVFLMNADEYEPEFCEQVLPTLNAKCRILEDIYGKDLFEKFEIHGFQLKVLSILASSFDDVLFLDADSVPLIDVENIFLKEPYTSTGYIIWPDYWYRTTSPHYYDIAGLTLGPRVRGDLLITDPTLIPQADLENALPDKSSESGQIVIKKSQHYKTLLLATYYNLHGFEIFYPLFGQGTMGEGDKETFLAAAVALNDTFYQVKSDCRSAGRVDEKNDFIGHGMLQYNPYDDYMIHNHDQSKFEPRDPRVQFMHFNYPKINPREMFDSGQDGDFFKKDENRIRYYGLPSQQHRIYDYKDIELEIWTECEWAVCEMGMKKGVRLQDWKNWNVTELCLRTQEHVRWLQSTHNA